MKIIALTLALIIVVAIVFIIVKSVMVKLISMFILVFGLILVFAFFGDNIKSKTQPIAIDNTTLIVYQDGEKMEIPNRTIQRVDVNIAEGGKVVITFIKGDARILVEVSKFSYEWRLKNSLNKQFQGRIYDHTF